jgi:hypothetical protein
LDLDVMPVIMVRLLRHDVPLPHLIRYSVLMPQLSDIFGVIPCPNSQHLHNDKPHSPAFAHHIPPPTIIIPFLNDVLSPSHMMQSEKQHGSCILYCHCTFPQHPHHMPQPPMLKHSLSTPCLTVNSVVLSKAIGM